MKLIKDGVLQVKVGDTIRYRNGKIETINQLMLDLRYAHFPVQINDERYRDNGSLEFDDTNQFDICAIIPATSPQGEPKPSRMIDLFAQGAEFVLGATGYVFRLQYDVIYQWTRVSWETPLAQDFMYCLFKPATIAENPEKPKRVVYNWVYKVENNALYSTTAGKFETMEDVVRALSHLTLVHIEKIEHSRGEV